MTATERAVEPSQTRVLFIIDGLQPAGMELRLLEFARHFPPTLEVHICVIGSDLTMLEEFQKTRARISHVPVRRAYTDWRNVRTIAAYVHDKDIHIVNSSDLKTLLIALAAKLWRRRERISVVHHLVGLWDALHEHHRMTTWQALRFTDLILCNGYAVKEGLNGWPTGRVPVAVIPNGVDCNHFRPSPELRRSERERLGFAPNDFVLGTVANVSPIKNYPFLLRGMRQLSELHPNVRLVCVGGGPQLEEMRAYARELSLQDCVQFVGQARDVRPWVATFDAFTLCSFKEGCPNSLMQAMAMGVACMSSDVGEVSRLTDNGTCGLLFNPTDSATCVQLASRLVTDELYRARLAQAGRRRMQEHYDASAMIDAYVALYARLGNSVLAQAAS